MKDSSTDFRSFLMLLQSESELVHVKRDVNAEYELAVVTAKLDGKQAVLFEKVQGSKTKVACNIVATPRRFYLAIAGGGGAHHKANQIDIKKNIHDRVT